METHRRKRPVWATRFNGHSNLLRGLLIATALVGGALFTAPAAGAHYYFPCGSGSLKYEHNPINYQVSGGLTANELSATLNAKNAWHNQTDANFSSGANDVWVGRSNQGSSGPAAYTQNNPSGCLIVWSDLIFNSYYTGGWPTGEIQNTAAHEFGHVLGMVHATTIDYCNPQSIMLEAHYDNWNLICQWNTPQPHDVSDTNAVY